MLFGSLNKYDALNHEVKEGKSGYNKLEDADAKNENNDAHDVTGGGEESGQERTEEEDDVMVRSMETLEVMMGIKVVVVVMMIMMKGSGKNMTRMRMTMLMVMVVIMMTMDIHC